MSETTADASVDATPVAWQALRDRATHATWLPALIVAGGWAAGWMVSLGLSSSQWISDLFTSVVVVLIGWCVTAPLVSAALRAVVPTVPLRRALLIAVGWPASILGGLAVPIGLSLSAEGAGILGLGVAAAGLLSALALTPADRPVAWDRVALVDVGWCAGWLWPGITAWPSAFWRLGHGYTSNFPDLLADGVFVGLVSAGILSGVTGGVLLYLLVVRPAAAPTASPNLMAE